MRNHVRRSDEQLRTRLEREPGIGAASTFTNESSAQTIAQYGIDANTPQITAWLNDDDGAATLTLDLTLGSVTGRTITREMWERDKQCGSVTTNRLLMVLRRRPAARNGFILVTAFPPE